MSLEHIRPARPYTSQPDNPNRRPQEKHPTKYPCRSPRASRSHANALRGSISRWRPLLGMGTGNLCNFCVTVKVATTEKGKPCLLALFERQKRVFAAFLCWLPATTERKSEQAILFNLQFK
ncbi:hypothetical protein BDZ97DRAFT_883537 [Flammula alnicola]|nr:hypothetical protein BDZ97DRAFT_883537 [Flammula alnicola]